MSAPVISRYTINQALGSGPLSSVYLATDPDFDGTVALKTMLANQVQPAGARLAFERLNRLLALLAHPGIVPVLDFGDFNGYFYIAQHYLPGGSLADRLALGPLELPEALYIFDQIAGALEACHAAGILHLDLKPANILFDEHGQPFLSDFGMPALVFANPQARLNPLLDNAAYISPELALGKTPPDERSDVYSLAALTYEMLAGVPPHAAAHPVQQAVQQIDQPVAALTWLNPDLPAQLDAVFDIALAKDAGQRYASVADFADDLLAACAAWLPEVAHLAALRAGDPHAGDLLANPPASGAGVVWLRRLAVAGFALLFMFALLVGGLWAAHINPADYLLLPAPLDQAVAFIYGTSTAQPAFVAASPTSPPQPSPTSRPPQSTPAAQPTAASPPQPTPAQELASPPPTLAPTVAPPVIGGADKLAFLNENEIWMINLDGTNPQRLTSDGAPKSNLQFTPDGSRLIFESEGTYYLLNLDSGSATNLGSFLDLSLSNDMRTAFVARQVLYPNLVRYYVNFAVAYQPASLRNLNLTNTSPCLFHGGRLVRFSQDGQQMAMIMDTNVDGKPVQALQVFTVPDCGDEPDLIDSIPGLRFTLRGYNLSPSDVPVIRDYAWDGYQSFALHGNVKQGFGDLVIYDQVRGVAETYQPLAGKCCYRDMRFSPDGNYLLFTFWDVRYTDPVQIYYVLFGSLGSGQIYEPVPIPFYFFQDPSALIEPALRPAR